MDLKTLHSIFEIGETVAVEFKRCGNGIEADTYETVCSFLNRFGGDIFLGVLDDGTVVGVPPKAAPDMVRNFIKVMANPKLFSPTVYLVPQIIEYDEKRTIIHVHIPPSAEVHSYKKVIYDRVNDADIKVTATGAIAQMYIRKQGIFTERKIYPYATLEDLRLDLLPKIRIMAKNHASGNHPWTAMDDMQLLKSAGLYGRDVVTGEEGFNLAAIMLLGKDEVILDVAPAYVTDALLRKVNIDRYDDREIIKTNLIESYDRLLEFGKKHLPDKFFLEDTVNKSLRNILLREMVSNVLMHREYSSIYQAKFIIERERMYVENANRAVNEGSITVNNLEPNSKNPIIAGFFRNIGYADQLGSGVRNLFKYSKYYSGKEPEFMEGDVFRIMVPLDDEYSYDYNLLDSNAHNITFVSERKQIYRASEKNIGEKHRRKTSEKNIGEKLNHTQREILNLLLENCKLTADEMASSIGISRRNIEANIRKLKDYGILYRHGSPKKGYWEVVDKLKTKETL